MIFSLFNNLKRVYVHSKFFFSVNYLPFPYVTFQFILFRFIFIYRFIFPQIKFVFIFHFLQYFHILFLSSILSNHFLPSKSKISLSFFFFISSHLKLFHHWIHFCPSGSHYKLKFPQFSLRSFEIIFRHIFSSRLHFYYSFLSFLSFSLLLHPRCPEYSLPSTSYIF